MISYRRQHFARLLLLATTVGVTGCTATQPFAARTHTSPTDPLDLVAQTAKGPSSPAVQQVAFDEMSLVDSKLEDMTPEKDKQEEKGENDANVRLAAPLESELDGMPLSEYQSGVAAMTLADFEALALGNNPTIQELVATTQKAAGFRTQVGLRANPSIGYQANQLADQGTDQHTVFISQTIVTADKLALNRCVLNEALRAQLLQLEAQKYRVTTDINVKFYDALAAQQRIDQISDFLSVVDKGLDLAELRKKALEGSQLDVLQAKVQKNEIELALQQAEVSYAAAWRELTALAGSPQMPPVRLLGELPESATTLDWSTLASTIIASSPEYQAAQTRVSQARANLERQCVQPIPNVDVQFAAGVDNSTNSGLINLQIGAPIPVFNKNQGNIAAARAELLRSAQEVHRIENSIKARLGAVSRDYDSSLAAVEKYAKDILPNAAESLQLAETAYKAGETSFVQVLVARRTYFDSNLQYIASQAQLGQARARVDGYVLTGALDAVIDNSGDDSLRGLTFSQQ
ncbi:Cobalt-zinc-cadmium resistance protein CzcC precursor [Novipirellula aureliae]|uniref:Cobalt-zinc-cadmium resistance protein CzcC n=1 Tax=Novipirellula aureliae TaxID=2527966 RepID=A0A5C6DRD7_9BACT|nr:TolC family protein [Novipirellula aureliae]TWU39853.1 Cobalt-zinc-cadmium resistance protein CzcC precursor [Novipirellula aureliae]